MTKSDPNWKRLQEERRSIENPKPDYGAGYRVESMGTFQGAAQKQLFPKWRFYASPTQLARWSDWVAQQLDVEPREREYRR